MSNPAKKISITLTPEMDRMVRAKVDAGQFGSSSEVIREALRVWQRREEEHEQKIAALKARVQKSLDDPRPALSTREARSAFEDFISNTTS